MKKILALAVISLLAGRLMAADFSPATQKMLEAKTWYFEQAVHPETRLIYQNIDLNDPDHWKKTVFPTPDSIRNRFCNDQERPNVSNSDISGGVFLGALVDSYDITKDPKCVEQARAVFAGLSKLAKISPRKGFVARSILPGDPTFAHLLNSSVDQYTFFVYAMYKYYHSPIASEAEKQDIRAMMNDICQMIMDDGTILATNGIPAGVSDIEAIRSDRSSRMLEVYMVGWDVTGEQKWRDYYLEKVREANYGRLRSLLDPIKVKCPYFPRDKVENTPHMGTIWQTQYSLVPLVEVEPDVSLRAAYVEAMRLNARLCEENFTGSSQQMEIILFAQNRSVLGDVKTPQDEETRKVMAERSQKFIAGGNERGGRGNHAVYWTAVKRGVLQP